MVIAAPFRNPNSSVSLFRTVERCPPVCKHTQTHTRSCSAARYYATTTETWHLNGNSVCGSETLDWVNGKQHGEMQGIMLDPGKLLQAKSTSISLCVFISLQPSFFLPHCLCTVCLPPTSPVMASINLSFFNLFPFLWMLFSLLFLKYRISSFLIGPHFSKDARKNIGPHKYNKTRSHTHFLCLSLFLANTSQRWRVQRSTLFALSQLKVWMRRLNQKSLSAFLWQHLKEHFSKKSAVPS